MPMAVEVQVTGTLLTPSPYPPRIHHLTIPLGLLYSIGR